MFSPVSRLRSGFLAAAGLLLLAAPAARAAVGQEYSVLGFKSWLERGYNTRLGWQGWPVSSEDPHLFLYSRDSLQMLSELEFLHADGRIHTQLLKLHRPIERLGAPEWRELEYFALEAGAIGADALRRLVKSQCQGEWRLGRLYITLINERAATWLRVSSRGSQAAKPFSQCSARSSAAAPRQDGN